MGQVVSNVFSDITEVGNVWKQDRVVAPFDPGDYNFYVRAYEDSSGDGANLSSVQRGSGSSPSSSACPHPQDLPGNLFDHTNGAENFQEDRHGGDAGRRRRDSLTNALRSRFSRPSFGIGRPSQVVLKHTDFHAWGAGGGGEPTWVSVKDCDLGSQLLLTEEKLADLQEALPISCRFACCWKLVYSPKVHGVSMATFYRQCETWSGESILIMEDTEGYVFGGFSSHPWKVSPAAHFGSMDCFVFTYGDAKEEGSLQVFPWAGGLQCFMHAALDCIAMGEACLDGFAIWIGHDFLHGKSAPSATFGTRAPLASSEEFVLRRLECWTFDHNFERQQLALELEKSMNEVLSKNMLRSPFSGRSPGEGLSPEERAPQMRASLWSRAVLALRVF